MSHSRAHYPSLANTQDAQDAFSKWRLDGEKVTSKPTGCIRNTSTQAYVANRRLHHLVEGSLALFTDSPTAKISVTSKAYTSTKVDDRTVISSGLRVQLWASPSRRLILDGPHRTHTQDTGIGDACGQRVHTQRGSKAGRYPGGQYLG